MHYDAVIIGAGLSGLAAGIRLAYFDRRVCLVERHNRGGGLNSFYHLGGRNFDVGLHAMTNFVPPGVRDSALPKLLRQLRLSRDDLQLCPQRYSLIHFDDAQLRFGNDLELLLDQVARRFPGQVDRLRRLIHKLPVLDQVPPDWNRRSGRALLAAYLDDPLLIEMLMLPLLYYGGPCPDDLNAEQLAILFRSIYLEGMARPRGGIRPLLQLLAEKFRACGGQLCFRCGVKELLSDGRRVTEVVLDSGQRLTADLILSCAGYLETMRLCRDEQTEPPAERPAPPGVMSFVEAMACLDAMPAELGIETTIVFFNRGPVFRYRPPAELIDPTSGVICCPNNYLDCGDLDEGMIRLTALANYDHWQALTRPAYQAAKEEAYQRLAASAATVIGDFRDRVVFRDLFTPRTIEHFTGHIHGAVYGAPAKRRDGRTRLQNLIICGTDQGLLGIVGSMLSGVLMANQHGLS